MIRYSLAPLFVASFLNSCDSKVEEADAGPEASSSMAIGPNGGFVYRLVGADDKGIGSAEIKLHDDKGDLEVWLNQGSLAESIRGGMPWDMALDTQLTVEFPGLEKEVTLTVRDSDTNADEAGKSMIREGKTNYFIFPGDSGADASWLQGHEFEEAAVLDFEADGVAASTKAIKLVPHGHGQGGHDHPHPH
ncbi:hypothetical protein [Haloferula sp.]|uniref:hypothetical protein n=1 Tax=Haloferula sp. TaxID=2497595 RepID=UPI00329FF89C